MKLSLFIILSLISLQTLATGGGPQAGRELEKRKMMNSQQEMEERHNNASVIIGTGGGTATDGYGTTEKDIRPQGKKRNADYSDTDLNTKDE